MNNLTSPADLKKNWKIALSYNKALAYCLFWSMLSNTAQKWSFPLRIYLVNVTKSTISFFAKKIFFFVRYNALNIQTPLRWKYARAYSNQSINKAIRRNIMTPSHLKNIYFKNQGTKNHDIYKKHRKFCWNLLRKLRESTFF